MKNGPTPTKKPARFGAEELALLTDKAVPPTGGIGDETLGTAIADAEAVINAALQQHYTLPFQNPPLLLQRIALDLVHERLHDGVLPEEVKRRGDHARTDSFMRRKNGAGLGCQRERGPRRPTRKFQCSKSGVWRQCA